MSVLGYSFGVSSVSKSSYCRLCKCPLEVESVSGLCATCLRTADTTLANPRPAPSPDPGVFPVPLDSSVFSSGNTASVGPAVVDPPTVSLLPAPGTRTHRPAQPQAQPFPDAPPGFDLIERLGGGGMGEVYLAREHFADRLVAMKFLRLAGNRGLIERFLRELRSLAALDHPNIVRVYANDFLRAEPYFTMEYASGGTLGQWVEKHGPFDPRDAAQLMATIARAIAAAHEKQTLHRDLKPSNILLAADGKLEVPTINDFVPKVADFGLAKQMDQETMTVGSSPIGTPHYMPPEQANRKNGEIGPASDVYGLGATLYFLLTGEAPFGAGEQAEIIIRVLTDPVPRPRAVKPEVPPDLDGIVVKCLEKDTKDRYPSALALAEDLEAFLSGKNVVAPRQTFVRRARRWAGRHRVRLATIGLLFAAVVAIAALWPPPPPVPRDDATPDHVAEMQKELIAGRHVKLIGDKDLPRWHRWALGAPELTRATDGTCQFEAVGYSLLELCPDPMTDRYVFRARIRVVESNVRDTGEPGRVVGTTSAGVYLAHSVAEGSDGLVVDALFTVTFNDMPRPTGADNAVRFRATTVQRKPNKAPSAGHIGNQWGTLTPATSLPGPWRTIEIEVTPERLIGRCEGPSGQMEVFVDLPGAEIHKSYAEIRRRLDTGTPGHGTMLPNWSARMPIGIWNHRATVNVKDVSINPLPPP